MRLPVFIVAACLPAMVLAQETTDVSETAAKPAAIAFNSSIGVSASFVATDAAGKRAEEDAYRRSLYERSVGECALLLETVAKSCVVTGISVSTQISSNPGQPDYLSASANISMAVELK